MPKLDYSLRTHYIGVLFVLSTVFITWIAYDRIMPGADLLYQTLLAGAAFFAFLYYAFLRKYEFMPAAALTLSAANIVPLLMVIMIGAGLSCMGNGCDTRDYWLRGVQSLVRDSTGILALEALVFGMALTYWLAGRKLGLR